MSRLDKHRFGFPPTLRIRRQADFDRVYRQNVFAADRVLVVQAYSNGLETSRLGLSVSRRVGNAVLRNRWKRLIREAYRCQRAAIPDGLDLVVRPRRGARPAAAEIARSLPQLARRLKKQLRRRP